MASQKGVYLLTFSISFVFPHGTFVSSLKSLYILVSLRLLNN